MYVKEEDLRRYVATNDLDSLALALYKMAEGLFSRYYSRQGLDQEEFVQSAVAWAITKTHRFDPTKGTAFNFFSTVINNDFRCILRKKRPTLFFSYLPQDIVDSWTTD